MFLSFIFPSLQRRSAGTNTAGEEEPGKVPSSTCAVIDRGSRPEVTGGTVWSVSGDKRDYCTEAPRDWAANWADVNVDVYVGVIRWRET